MKRGGCGTVGIFSDTCGESDSNPVSRKHTNFSCRRDGPKVAWSVDRLNVAWTVGTAHRNCGDGSRVVAAWVRILPVSRAGGWRDAQREYPIRMRSVQRCGLSTAHRRQESQESRPSPLQAAPCGEIVGRFWRDCGEIVETSWEWDDVVRCGGVTSLATAGSTLWRGCGEIVESE